MTRLPRYKSPEIGAHGDTLKRLVSDFVHQAAGNPEYNTVNVVHDCVVYVMQNKPPGLGRVDGALVQPIIQEIVYGMIQQRPASSPAALAAPRQSWLRRALGTVVAAARHFVN